MDRLQKAAEELEQARKAWDEAGKGGKTCPKEYEIWRAAYDRWLAAGGVAED